MNSSRPRKGVSRSLGSSNSEVKSSCQAWVAAPGSSESRDVCHLNTEVSRKSQTRKVASDAYHRKRKPHCVQRIRPTTRANLMLSSLQAYGRKHLGQAHSF